MSTDQQWVGGGRMGFQHEQIHERRVPLHKRLLPFAGLYVMSFLIFPALELACWLWGHFNAQAREELAFGWLATASVLAFVALAVGTVVSRRTPFVIWHVVVTVFLACFAAGLTTLIGLFSTTWLVIHFFGSLVVPSSWTMYRVDALRAIAQGSTKDAWGEVIGLAKSRPRRIRTDEHHVTIEVEHGPGETSEDVSRAAKRLESAVGAIKGRTIVQDGERSDTSTLILQMADPFAEWRSHPGLSHPGGSFAHPFRTAYYATGADEWFSFVPSLPTKATPFRSPSATFIGAAGTTGAGKSGFLQNAAAEALSRRDVILCWADAEKFLQNAGPFVDMLGMAAKDKPQARRMTAALRRLAEYRVGLFGQAALDAILDPDAPQIGREWTPELARETGEAAVLVIADEADTIIKTSAWEWLGARGRSLGIFILAAIPRASTNEVSAIMRGSIATWKTFAIGDKYSDDFTLSSETREAGADPKRLREPGLHYLDMAPGVKPQMYPVLAREFKSSGKFLRQQVLMARELFSPAVFSQAALEWMGDDYRACRFELAMGTRSPQQIAEESDAAREADAQAAAQRAEQPPPDDTPTRALTPAEQAAAEDAAGNQTPSDRVAEDEQGEDEPLMRTPTGTLPDDDQVSVVDPASIVDPDLAREMSKIDPRIPIDPTTSGLGITLPTADGKPRWDAERTEAEMDAALRRLADRGKMAFSNADLIKEMACAFSEATCSRRLNDLAEGKRLNPPGLAIERLGRGNFQMTKTPPAPSR